MRVNQGGNMGKIYAQLELSNLYDPKKKVTVDILGHRLVPVKYFDMRKNYYSIQQSVISIQQKIIKQ